MKWIKAKMEELGCTNNPSYKICFMLDSMAMITVHTPQYGVIEVRADSYNYKAVLEPTAVLCT